MKEQIETTLQRLTAEVAERLGDSVNFVSFAYGPIEGRWSWSCDVRAKTKQTGRGTKHVRAAMHAYGATPEEVKDAMLEEIASWERFYESERKQEAARKASRRAK